MSKCEIIMLTCDLHVNIIILHVDINTYKLQMNIIMLHIDMVIYFVM